MRGQGQEMQAVRLDERAQLDDRQGQLIRDALLNAPAAPSTEAFAVAQALGDSGA